MYSWQYYFLFLESITTALWYVAGILLTTGAALFLFSVHKNAASWMNCKIKRPYSVKFKDTAISHSMYKAVRS